MLRHYIYRMDHDTGFAPNISYGICSICGCKTTTVEKWATVGSWIIGIGGNSTCHPDQLIYTMQVEEKLTYDEFCQKYKRKSQCLSQATIGLADPVLISRHYYYLGDRATRLPNELSHIIIRRQGCKRVNDSDICILNNWLKKEYGKGGSIGEPLNIPLPKKC